MGRWVAEREKYVTRFLDFLDLNGFDEDDRHHRRRRRVDELCRETVVVVYLENVIDRHWCRVKDKMTKCKTETNARWIVWSTDDDAFALLHCYGSISRDVTKTSNRWSISSDHTDEQWACPWIALLSSRRTMVWKDNMEKEILSLCLSSSIDRRDGQEEEAEERSVERKRKQSMIKEERASTRATSVTRVSDKSILEDTTNVKRWSLSLFHDTHTHTHKSNSPCTCGQHAVEIDGVVSECVTHWCKSTIGCEERTSVVANKWVEDRPVRR